MSSTKYKVRIYPSAENDLMESKDYFVNKLQTSPNELFDKLLKTMDVLEENPFIFPLLKDIFLNQSGYRMVPIDNFLLFYSIENSEVQIHRFLYGKRNYLDIL